MQGSDFDGKRLIEIAGNKSEIINLPTMNLYWMEQKDINTEDTSSIDIPVYENIFREHFICKLRILLPGNTDDTIWMGIAIFLDS